MAHTLKANWLDRTIAYFSPQRAARRMRARVAMELVESYIGADSRRRATKEWNTWPGSADEETIQNLTLLRSRSRDLVRNEPLATGAVLTLGTHAIGSGLSLLARPDWEFLGLSEDQSEEWSSNVEREFRAWAESKDCDATRIQNFYELQSLILRSTIESGDCFVLLPMIERGNPYDLAVQVVEADRVDTPPERSAQTNIRGGVEIDLNGAPLAYYILREHPGSRFGASLLKVGADRIPAYGLLTGRRNVLHLFDRTRPEQNRGVPWMAPIIEPLKQLGRYSEAELMAAVVNSMLAVFVKTQGDGFAPAPLTAEGEQSTLASTQPGVVRLESGTITDLGPGEDIESIIPGRPNVAFDTFVQAILRQIGVALGLPFEVLIKHFTASYSAARAALLEAWKTYLHWRSFVGENFCTPVYTAWMWEAVARGRVQAPRFFDDPMVRQAWLACEWIGDGPAQIDPTKEVDAAKTRIEIGVSSIQRETMALSGAEWQDVHREQVKEKQARQRDGLEASAAASRQNGRAAATQPPGPDREEEDKG